MIPVSSGEQSNTRLSFITLLLIAACVWAFVVVQPSSQASQDESDRAQLFVVDHAAIPCEVLRNQGLTRDEYNAVFVDRSTQSCSSSPSGAAVSESKHLYLALIYSMFLHAGWIHLLGNMLSLWVFGSAVEKSVGWRTYVLMYLVGGVIATLGHIGGASGSAIPIIGASGAIASIMGVYLVLYPLSIVRIWLLVLVPMPAVVFLGLWFALQFTVGESSGVAWVAHVSGFLTGIAMGLWWRRKHKPLTSTFALKQAD